MPEVEFRVLCADRKSACDRVKQIMREDFGRLENTDSSKIYDHFGKRSFRTVLDAKTRRNEIYKLAGQDVKGIELIIS